MNPDLWHKPNPDEPLIAVDVNDYTPTNEPLTIDRLTSSPMKLAAYTTAGLALTTLGIYWTTQGHWLAGTSLIILAIGSSGLYRNT